MFGRKERRSPLQREADNQLENIRDDCVALFIDSGLTQKQLHERGGPTPQTTSRWLYKETHFPRYDTIEKFMLALECDLVPMPIAAAQEWRAKPMHERLGLSTQFVRTPRMPDRKGRK